MRVTMAYFSTSENLETWYFIFNAVLMALTSLVYFKSSCFNSVSEWKIPFIARVSILEQIEKNNFEGKKEQIMHNLGNSLTLFSY